MISPMTERDFSANPYLSKPSEWHWDLWSKRNSLCKSRSLLLSSFPVPWFLPHHLRSPMTRTSRIWHLACMWLCTQLNYGRLHILGGLDRWHRGYFKVVSQTKLSLMTGLRVLRSPSNHLRFQAVCHCALRRLLLYPNGNATLGRWFKKIAEAR